jgi:hypothetical protein
MTINTTLVNSNLLSRFNIKIINININELIKTFTLARFLPYLSYKLIK